MPGGNGLILKPTFPTCFSSCRYDMLRKSTLTALQGGHRNKTNGSSKKTSTSTLIALAVIKWRLVPVEQLVVDVLGSVHVATNAVDNLNQLLQLILQSLRDQREKRRVRRESAIALQQIKGGSESSCTCPVLRFVSRDQALVPLGTSLLRRHNRQMAKSFTPLTVKMICIVR